MEFHWSFVEVERTTLIVCENIGTLPIRLVRTGDVNTPAYVSVHVEDKSTRKNDDYKTTHSRQVQFDPGAFYSSLDRYFSWNSI